MQLGFYFDEQRCIRCHSCEMACSQIHNIETGMHWRKVYYSPQGTNPNVRRPSLSLSCNHCENPPCIPACRSGALYKRSSDGLVLIDPDKCDGCPDCVAACPYQAIGVGTSGKAQKCTACEERLALGLEPACTRACPTRAVQFGPTQELAARAGAKRVAGAAQPALFARYEGLDLEAYRLDRFS